MKFHGDIRELLIGQWKAIEKAGGRPTINAILKAARECYGATFDNSLGFAVLKPLSEASQRTFPDQIEKYRGNSRTKYQRESREPADSSQRTPENFSRINREPRRTSREPAEKEQRACARANEGKESEQATQAANDLADEYAALQRQKLAAKPALDMRDEITPEQRRANITRLREMAKSFGLAL